MERSAGTWARQALPAGVAVLAAALALVATRDGMGTTPDGVSYLGAATNLAGGRGLTGPFPTMVDPFGPAEALAFDGAVPFIQWPPLYPLLLGLGASMGLAPETVARALSTVGLAATVALTAWIVLRLAPTGRRSAPLLAGLAAGWVLLSPYLALLHVLVASEHLFTALLLGALFCGARWLGDATTGRGWAGAAVGLATAATLTRFVGAAAVGGLALGVLVLGAGPLGRRAARAAGVAAIGLGPALVWSQVTAAQAGVSSRTLAWHPPDRVQWEGVVQTVTGWLVRADAPTALRALAVAVGLGLAALAAVGWRSLLAPLRERPDPTAAPAPPTEARPWLLLASTTTLLYLAAVVATHALFDRAVPVGQRLLVPIQPLLAVTVAVGVGWWLERRAAPATPSDRPAHRRWLAPAAAVGAALLVVGLESSWRPLVEPGRPWAPDPAGTETGRWLAERPAGAPVASNDPALAWQSGGGLVIALPVRTSAPTGRANPAFAEQLAELHRLLDERDGAVVVYGTSAVLNPHVAGVADLEAAGFRVVRHLPDATALVPIDDVRR